MLYNFANNPDGGNPDASLTSDGAGNFYGTTEYGGAYFGGTVFELTPNGSGGWNETVLYSFCSVVGAHCTDGATLFDSYVIFDSVGNLYGTTYAGGANGAGTVFELSPAGASWTETVLYNFCSQSGCADGADPINGLIMDPAGNLYGTTLQGANGVVFELSPSGGGWTEQVIYTGSGPMGAVADSVPYGVAGLAMDAAGNLYGTTGYGGGKGYGMVYRLSPVENGGWKEKILYSFKGGNKDGSRPLAGVVLDAVGNIYGTTYEGGESGEGTVFELVAPVGKGSYKEKVFWSFNGTDGSAPYGGLTLDSAGNLYGTATYGGSSGYGVVFEVNPSAAATTTTLTSSLNPSTYGQAVTFTAVVASSAGVPPDGETVTFVDGSTELGMGALTAGSASFTTSALPVGRSTITAVYGGDLNFDGSTSNKVRQVVKK